MLLPIATSYDCSVRNPEEVVEIGDDGIRVWDVLH